MTYGYSTEHTDDKAQESAETEKVRVVTTQKNARHKEYRVLVVQHHSRETKSMISESFLLPKHPEVRARLIEEVEALPTAKAVVQLMRRRNCMMADFLDQKNMVYPSIVFSHEDLDLEEEDLEQTNKSTIYGEFYKDDNNGGMMRCNSKEVKFVITLTSHEPDAFLGDLIAQQKIAMFALPTKERIFIAPAAHYGYE